jgi:hypothetical protein
MSYFDRKDNQSQLIGCGMLFLVVTFVLVMGPPLIYEMILKGSRWRGAWQVLSVAQILSILGCIGSIVVPFFHVGKLLQTVRASGKQGNQTNLWLWIGADFVGGFVAFCFWAAVFIVFVRIKNFE